MNALVVGIVIFLVIFVIGVVVGVIAVNALAAVRSSRQQAMLPRPGRNAADTDDDADELPEHEHGFGIPGHWDSISSDTDPGRRWPGDTP